MCVKAGKLEQGFPDAVSDPVSLAGMRHVERSRGKYWGCWIAGALEFPTKGIPTWIPLPIDGHYSHDSSHLGSACCVCPALGHGS